MTSILGAIDLSAITTGIGDIETAVLALAPVAVAAGLGLMAIKFGGKWVLKLFRSFSN